MLRSILEALDQLERRYISKKEEHRALEMQNYMGLSRNTGAFDPNRHVEGDIFRIGMHLEDIKEMIDRSVCEQISPPRSSSTPVKDLLDMRPLCMSTPLPLPPLHEVIMSTVAPVLVNLCGSSPVCNEMLSGLVCQASGADLTTPHSKTEAWKEGRNEVNKNVTLQTSSELTTSDPPLRNGGRSSSVSR